MGALLSVKMGVRSGLRAIQYLISNFSSHGWSQAEFTPDNVNLALNTEQLIFNGLSCGIHYCSVGAAQILMIL